MCRNIKTLFNFEPPATHAEIHASALQFVRKLSGFNSPSQANAEAFNRAVSEVSDSARRLLASLQTNAPARDREIEAEKARERSRPDSVRDPAHSGVNRFRLHWLHVRANGGSHDADDFAETERRCFRRAVVRLDAVPER
jgi:hypothetical protein